MITKVQPTDISYKGARVNVLALSDSHGNFMKIPKVLKTIETHVADIYAKADAPSTLNTVGYTTNTRPVPCVTRSATAVPDCIDM